MKFAITSAVVLASLITLNSAQSTANGLTCTSAAFEIDLEPGLTYTPQDIDAKLSASSTSCTFGETSNLKQRGGFVEIRVNGMNRGFCGSDLTPNDKGVVGIPSFNGTAIVEGWKSEEEYNSGEDPSMKFEGPVGGKITTGGIQLEGEIKGENKGKIIRIRGEGTSEGDKELEDRKCKSNYGYVWMKGTLSLISVSDK
ncbi:hypothetical protein GQ42DRAFT_156604 [Ramicandelaber brevisporus]|nr:hypothetical protein GQ42DRAFT_156604 [Ramicandelaber brevisporus]